MLFIDRSHVTSQHNLGFEIEYINLATLDYILRVIFDPKQKEQQICN